MDLRPDRFSFPDPQGIGGWGPYPVGGVSAAGRKPALENYQPEPRMSRQSYSQSAVEGGGMRPPFRRLMSNFGTSIRGLVCGRANLPGSLAHSMPRKTKLRDKNFLGDLRVLAVKFSTPAGQLGRMTPLCRGRAFLGGCRAPFRLAVRSLPRRRVVEGTGKLNPNAAWHGGESQETGNFVKICTLTPIPG